MLIHGKLHLTANGLNLDEVRSLLQKALRRKERDLVLQSCKELIGQGKDQLPWKSLVTFLYEDHCLSDQDVITRLWNCYTDDNKYKAVELLLKAYTCRYAACLPVVSLLDMYHPAANWDPDLPIDDSLKDLVVKQSECIHFDLLLAHLKKAWEEKDKRNLIAYIKLASVVQDHENRAITGKGNKYLITSVARPTLAKGKPTAGLVVLSLFYKLCKDDRNMRTYLFYSFKLASLPEVCVRLVLFSAVTQLIYRDSVKKIDDMKLGIVRWSEVSKISRMPSWAVDKHTFRGKHGKGTNHIVKKKPNGMTDNEYEEFHGTRDKHDIKHFFNEGCRIKQETIPGENPYWEDTKTIYFKQTPKLQKTVRMTANYYKQLKLCHRELLYRSVAVSGKKTAVLITSSKSGIVSGETISSFSDSKKEIATIFRATRKRDSAVVTNKPKSDEHQSDKAEKSPAMKRRKVAKTNDDCVIEDTKEMETEKGEMDIVSFDIMSDEKSKNGDLNVLSINRKRRFENEAKMGLSVARPDSKGVSCDSKPSTSKSLPIVESNIPPSFGPLLQLPTGSGKVYTRLSLDKSKVWKGPYRKERMNIVLFFHKVLKDILGDPHTLDIEVREPYLIFPLVKGSSVTEIKIVKKDFKDAISKTEIKDGEFVLRESLGIVQCHRIGAEKIQLLPMTFWLHFIWRFALNIGDSGLYNAITDDKMSFLYGIDMEEYRSRVAENSLVGYLFPKAPAKPYVNEIWNSLKKNKQELENLVAKAVNYAGIDRLSQIYGVRFERSLFIDRIKQVRKAVSQL